MNALLEIIRNYADKAHGDQQRRYSEERYIVHPVRVMEICNQYTNDQAVLAAALLHDVLEDTPVTAGELQSFLLTVMDPGMAGRTLQFVVELTDVYTKKQYPQLNRYKRKQKETKRLSKAGAEAQTIKYADIIDNCPEIASEDPDFADRYLTECTMLLRYMTKGDQDLHNRALRTVGETIQQVKKSAQEKL